MIPPTGIPCFRFSRQVLVSLVYGGFGLAALLAAPPSAQAQAKVYVVGHGPWTASGVPQYLTVINGATRQKGPRIPLGLSSGNHSSIALAPDGQHAYVINDHEATVSVVSTVTDTVIQTLPKSLLLGPNILQSPVVWVAVSPDGERLYVQNSIGIAVIDLASMTRVNYLAGVYGRLVVSPDGTRLYVRMAGGESTGPDRVLVLDSTSLATLAEASMSGGDWRGFDISITPDGRFVHLTRSLYGGGGALAVLDTATNTIVHERPTPNAYASASETSPNGAYLYVVGSAAQDQLYRFSPTTHLELSTSNGFGYSYDVAFTADSAYAYVAALTGVYVVNTATHAKTATIAFNANTDGSPRAVAVLGANPIEPTPSNFRATSIIGNRVTLAWNQPASGPPIGYVIEGGTTPGSVLASLPTGSAATSFTFDAPTGAFYLRVRASTSSGLSPASNEIQIFVNVPRPPSAPTDLLGLANGSAVALSWRNTLDGGAPTSLVLDVSGTLSVSVPLSLSETFSFASVPPGTYTFRVRAVNGAGISPSSSAVTLTFPNACPGPPQAPENVVVQHVGSLVSVAWDPPGAGPAVTSYVLRVAGAINLALPLSVRRVAGNVPSGTYSLSVMAVNPCGSGMESVPQSVTVP